MRRAHPQQPTPLGNPKSKKISKNREKHFQIEKPKKK
jgi:hypothetical protein